jgi:glycosyltransferase involved in cell wall biosynthesis
MRKPDDSGLPAVQLTILIPVYNEADTLETVVTCALAADTLGRTREVILIDDASGDGSADLARRLAERHPEIRLLTHPTNRGKGAALRTGLAAARGEIVLIQDADLEYDSADYPALLAPFAKGADVVYGSRFRRPGNAAGTRPWQRGGNWLLTQLSNLLTGFGLTDMETGYKVIRRSLLDRIRLREERFGIEPEMTVKLARLRPRPRLVEVPIHYASRGYAAGKKLTPLDGLRALYCLVRYRILG